MKKALAAPVLGDVYAGLGCSQDFLSLDPWSRAPAIDHSLRQQKTPDIWHPSLTPQTSEAYRGSLDW